MCIRWLIAYPLGTLGARAGMTPTFAVHALIAAGSIAKDNYAQASHPSPLFLTPGPHRLRGVVLRIAAAAAHLPR